MVFYAHNPSVNGTDMENRTKVSKNQRDRRETIFYLLRIICLKPLKDQSKSLIVNPWRKKNTNLI